MGPAPTSARRLLHGIVLPIALFLASTASRADDFAPGASAEESLAAWRRAVDAGGDLSELDLLRAGSRVLLAERPIHADVVRARVKALPETASLRFATARDRAAFVPRGPAKDLPPVLLKREEGVWRIDLVELEKSYVTPPGDALPPAVNDANPYAALVPTSQRFLSADLSEVDLLGEPLRAALDRLGRARDADSQRRLGELLLRNCWLVDDALGRFAEAARLEPKRYAHARTFAWRAWAAGEPDAAVPLLETWRPFSDGELAKLHARAGRGEIAQQLERRALQQLLWKNAPPPEPEDDPAPAQPAPSTITH
jgi:hypothetical protein